MDLMPRGGSRDSLFLPNGEIVNGTAAGRQQTPPSTPPPPTYLVMNSSNLELVRLRLDQCVSATGLCSGGPR